MIYKENLKNIQKTDYLKSSPPRGGYWRKTRNPPPPLTNSIQALETRERGRRRGQKTALYPAIATRSVALECFGLSRIRCAGCLCADGRKSSGSKEDSCQVAGQYGLPDLMSAKIRRTSFLAAWEMATL